MQQNAPQQRRPTKDYSPRKHKSRAATVLPLLLLFIALLAAMYFVFPKEAGKHVGSSIYDGLVISEVMAANSSAVPDENGEFTDWLELYNGTGQDLNLEGVMITNRTDRITFPFPSYVLKAGEYVIVFADNRYQLDPSMPFHGKFKISSVGTHLYLYDPNMYLIDEVVTPTMTADQSYILTGADENGKKKYELTDYYSPGYENTEAGFSAYRAVNSTQNGALVINEVCPDPKVGIPDEDGDIVDWVELHNTTNQSISLTGYSLSDKENKPLKWRFPDSATIGPNGYYLVYCSGKDKLQSNGVPHTNFSISAERETIVLSDANGHLVDRVSIENVPVDYSVGRDKNNEWQFYAQATPGSANDADGQSKTDELIRAFNPTGVYISEVMASNDTVVLGTSAVTSDFVELYNSSSDTVDLSYYGLSDTLNRPRRWQFPQGTVIAPGEYKVIVLDGNSAASSYYEMHTNFSLTRAGGETICFCDPQGKVLDRIPLTLIPTDHSYGRSIGYAGFYYYNTPTPGAVNGTGYYGYASNPSFSQRGGEYKGSVQVSITVPKDMAVYYTLDGAIPTENSTLYNAGDVFDISRVTVLRARAFDPAGLLQPSETTTQTYLPNVYHAFPIVSVVADPNELWSAENGMLTIGPNVDKSKGIPFKNTVYREFGKIAREGYIEMYLKDGTQLFSQGMEFALQGQYSLDMPQKSMKIKSKAKYGEKYFEAKLFDDRPYTEYKGFVLRNSGNDCVWTRMNDGFQSRLIDAFNAFSSTPSTVIHQAWNPVVVYLNGQYWGHYNMRERVDRYFVAQHEGLDLTQANNMDICEASGKAFFGSSKEYTAMIKRIKASSPGTNASDLQYILDNIDVDNYFDYMAFEMFFGNSDPGNIRFYRLKTDGSKWRWIFYDADYGLFRSGFDSVTSYLKESGAGEQKIDNTLIRKLLENKEMEDKFLTRLGEIYQFFSTDKMLEIFNAMATQLEPEMSMHFARWAEENDKAINIDSPTTPEGALRYWYTRLDYNRNVLKKRPTYFYEMVQERLALTDEQMLQYFGAKPALPDDAVYTEGKKWG
ncbi:MAG TPA: lamin tail domain-containing protein [Candidatus Limiplasma sp.]|nr:lamin tail domain-containing protein [Candidatus Limiplasma sp.]HPS81204.1 lamin tail domain-containing protein [Candidatus Limiplasma sp.]